MQYTAQKTLIALVFTIYICSCVALEYFFDGKEVYPVYSWSLFTKIPNPTKDMTVRVHEFNGKKYNPPLTFDELSVLLLGDMGHSPTQFSQAVSRLGFAVEKNKPDDVIRERAYFEALFRGKSFRYDVVKITYDPLLFFKDRKPETEKHVASFSNLK